MPLGEAGGFVHIVTPYVTFNVLNMPAGIAPITKYSEADTEAMKGYPSKPKPFHEEQELQVLNILEQNSNYKSCLKFWKIKPQAYILCMIKIMTTTINMNI